MCVIVINGRYLSQPLTGVQRVASELVCALDREIAAGRISPGKARLLFAISQLCPSLGDWIVRRETD